MTEPDSQRLSIEALLHYKTNAPCDVLMQLGVANGGDQSTIGSQFDIEKGVVNKTIPGEEAIGNRQWLTLDDALHFRYTATVDVARHTVDPADFQATPLAELPPETIKYLMASRYCDASEFVTFSSDTFGTLAGGERIAAIVKWVRDNLSYTADVSGPQTTALDTLEQRAGVCRDYAHLVIALARAASVPARYASVYSPDVEPQDFHAVAQVYLEGAWHLVDATDMAQASSMALIGVGRDAADVSFLTAYGMLDLVEQSVSVTRA